MASHAADQHGWQPGQRVRVKRGPFRDFIGTIAFVDDSAQTARIALNIFNRPTQVDLAFGDIEGVSGSQSGFTGH